MIRYRRMALLCLIFSVLLAVPASATCYRYVDDKGIAHYTDDFSTIPEQYQLQIEPDPEFVSRRKAETHRVLEATDTLTFPEGPAASIKSGESIQLQPIETKTEKLLPTTTIPPVEETKPEIDKKAQEDETQKLIAKRKTLLEKKELLDKKFDALLEDKKQLEAARERMDDEKQIETYNERVKRLNEKISAFKKEEEMLRVDIEGFNESINRTSAPRQR